MVIKIISESNYYFHYVQAREYRENSIGVETVDTATVFNNLGCCMYMLERNKEVNV